MLLHAGLGSQKTPQLEGTSEEKYFLSSYSCWLGFVFPLGLSVGPNLPMLLLSSSTLSLFFLLVSFSIHLL